MIVHTVEQFNNINCAELVSVDIALNTFFKTIKDKSSSNLITYKDIRHQYPNKYNIFFNHRRTRPKVITCNDPETIKKIRAIMSKISPQNYTIMKEKFLGFLKDATIPIMEIADAVYINLIDNISMNVNLFIDLISQIAPEVPKLAFYLHQSINHQIYNPKQFTINTITETAEDKIKRYKIGNALLITNMFLRRLYSPKFFLLSVIHWIENVSPTNLIDLEIFVKILPLLSKKHLTANIIKKLNEITNTKEYPNRLRYLLIIKD